MFVVTLVLFKSHCYFFKIYFAADTATSKPEADLFDIISQNRDSDYLTHHGIIEIRLTVARTRRISSRSFDKKGRLEFHGRYWLTDGGGVCGGAEPLPR